MCAHKYTRASICFEQQISDVFYLFTRIWMLEMESKYKLNKCKNEVMFFSLSAFLRFQHELIFFFPLNILRHHIPHVFCMSWFYFHIFNV